MLQPGMRRASSHISCSSPCPPCSPCFNPQAFCCVGASLAYHAAMKQNPNANANPVVRLKIERRSNHPWIFQKMVEKPEPRPKPGSVVDTINRDGTFAGP